MPRVPLAAVAALLTALALAPAAQARDATVTSFDGTAIVVHFFPAEGLKAGERAPTVLSGHGWAGSGSTNPDSESSASGTVGNGPLRKAGYNVLTWDARGFGASGGVVQVDSPTAEARDVQALLDFIAAQPDAALDGPGDPRAGMVGGSYGGGIQLTTAGLPEPRIDVLVPDIAWHSLTTSLYKDQTFKAGWGNALVAAGVPTANAQGEGLDPHITSAAAEANSTGVLSEENVNWFAGRGPGDLVKNIKVPTFLTQGTPDTLFTLDEAVTNFRILRSNGVPVKMLWHCGGHAVCTAPGKNGSEPLRIEKAVLAWLSRHLDKRTGVDTGPRFEWVADDGKWRTAADYPLASAGSVAGSGDGTLPIKPTPGSSGAGVAATPAADALSVAIAAPKAAAQAVGAPKLSLTYTGQGSGERTKVFAQVVDTAADVVLGNHSTPIPVTLDGKEHTVERPLEMVAASLTPASKLELQLTDSTSVYGPQRATGTLAVSKLRVEVPLVDPAATPAGSDSGGSGGGGSSAPAAKRAKVRVGFPGSARSHRGTRRLRAVVRTSAPVSRVKVVLRTSRGRRVGSATAARVTSRRTLTLRLKRGLRPGRYSVTVTYGSGRTTRTVRFKR